MKTVSAPAGLERSVAGLELAGAGRVRDIDESSDHAAAAVLPDRDGQSGTVEVDGRAFDARSLRPLNELQIGRIGNVDRRVAATELNTSAVRRSQVPELADVEITEDDLAGAANLSRTTVRSVLGGLRLGG